MLLSCIFWSILICQVEEAGCTIVTIHPCYRHSRVLLFRLNVHGLWKQRDAVHSMCLRVTPFFFWKATLIAFFPRARGQLISELDRTLHVGYKAHLTEAHDLVEIFFRVWCSNQGPRAPKNHNPCAADEKQLAFFLILCFML